MQSLVWSSHLETHQDRLRGAARHPACPWLVPPLLRSHATARTMSCSVAAEPLSARMVDGSAASDCAIRPGARNISAAAAVIGRRPAAPGREIQANSGTAGVNAVRIAFALLGGRAHSQVQTKARSPHK